MKRLEYSWEFSSRLKDIKLSGAETSLKNAKSNIINLEIKYGSRSMTAKITNNVGSEWSYRPDERVSGRMVWYRE